MKTLAIQAMHTLREGLIVGRDFTVDADGTLLTYKDPKKRPRPSPTQLANAIAALEAKAAEEVAFAAARRQMRSLIAALPTVTKARVWSEFVVVNQLLDSKQPDRIAAARARVEAVQRPGDSELTEEEFDAAKAELLALFPAPVVTPQS